MQTARDPFTLVSQLLTDSRLSTMDLQERPGEVPAELNRAFNRSGTPMPLPAPRTQGYPLESVLRIRTAIRTYGIESVLLADAGTVLATGVAADRAGWQEERAAGVDLDLLLLAWHVEGLHGLYHYHPDEHQLSLVGPAPSQLEAEQLVLQKEFARAPVVMLVTGNLAAAMARHGSHGHRQLLLRAGEAAHSAWLAAISLGMVGSVFAGLLPHALQEIAGTDGYCQAPLFALALGRPPAVIDPKSQRGKERMQR